MSNNNSSGKDPINYSDGIKAAVYVDSQIKEYKGKAAICGGLALHLYGFTRATKDIDIISDMPLKIKGGKKLNFGGVSYKIKVGDKNIDVDLIIRSDDAKELYQQALNNSKINKNLGVKVVTPEYMVILKYLAGRGKDQIDLLWLLREDGLVNRDKVIDIIKKNMGKHSYWAIRNLENVFLEADLLRARDNRGE